MPAGAAALRGSVSNLSDTLRDSRVGGNLGGWLPAYAGKTGWSFVSRELLRFNRCFSGSRAACLSRVTRNRKLQVLAAREHRQHAHQAVYATEFIVQHVY